MGLSISQAVFLNKLLAIIPRLQPDISASDVLRAGAYDLTSLTSDPRVLLILRQAYRTTSVRLWDGVAQY